MAVGVGYGRIVVSKMVLVFDANTNITPSTIESLQTVMLIEIYVTGVLIRVTFISYSIYIYTESAV